MFATSLRTSSPTTSLSPPFVKILNNNNNGIIIQHKIIINSGRDIMVRISFLISGASISLLTWISAKKFSQKRLNKINIYQITRFQSRAGKTCTFKRGLIQKREKSGRKLM